MQREHRLKRVHEQSPGARSQLSPTSGNDRGAARKQQHREDEAAALKSEENNRLSCERHRAENEMEALHQSNEELRVLLAKEIKKYERMLRDRNDDITVLEENLKN